MYSCTYLEDASGVQRIPSFTARKRRLARCLMDGCCADLLECIVVVVRMIVVLSWKGVAASTTTYFNCRQRQRMQLTCMKGINRHILSLHNSPVVMCKVSSMHSLSFIVRAAANRLNLRTCIKQSADTIAHSNIL